MDFYQITQYQADTLRKLADSNGEIPYIVLIGPKYDDDAETSKKLADTLQDVTDLVGLGFFHRLEGKVSPDEGTTYSMIEMKLSEEIGRTVAMYALTKVGKIMFKDVGERSLV